MWFAQDGALGSDTHDSSALVMDQTEDTLAVSSSSPSAAHAASPAERRSSGSQHELKASGSRLSFADLPSHPLSARVGHCRTFLPTHLLIAFSKAHSSCTAMTTQRTRSTHGILNTSSRTHLDPTAGAAAARNSLSPPIILAFTRSQRGGFPKRCAPLLSLISM